MVSVLRWMACDKNSKKWGGGRISATTRGCKEKIRWAGSFACVLVFSSGVMAGYY